MTEGPEIAVEGKFDVADDYISPTTFYYQTRQDFDIALGEHFIDSVNEVTTKSAKSRFLVGLSHGQSPSGAYQYILDNYDRIQHPEAIRYTFVNSPLKRQRDLKDVTDATVFLHKLVKQGLLEKKNILGSLLTRENMEAYVEQFNERFSSYLKIHKKKGLDYVFLATNPAGHVAGITRNSDLFDSEEIIEIVLDRKEKEMTVTPYFLKKSRRIAFLATKADKRRALVWLLYRFGKDNESPSFLRHIDRVEERLFVFVDDEALNWPQIEIKRKTIHGVSTIKVDVPKPYNPDTKRKLPVILMIHGFLGLNSFDGLLTNLSSHKYLPAAMHYGSIPEKLQVKHYSKHVVNNIDAVISFFGEQGHPVYLLDHSMGNIYFLMMNRDLKELKGVKKYLKGRIGANPFFGIESKHAVMGFMDNVILPSMSIARNPIEKTMFATMRRVIPIDTKKGVRNRSLTLSDFLIRKDSKMRDRVWASVKARIIHLMTKMDSLPELNRIPIARALNRLPAKVFVIQIYAALLESKTFDNQVGLKNIEKLGIPVTVLKSDRDCIAKFVPRFYDDGSTKIIDVTNDDEDDLFREHLYHMVNPEKMIGLLERFIENAENPAA